ncbi:MAG: site-2 protease family protein [Chloroflexi bacterium]|nr:site-2 protease family protein [Chloroflexota bacterium]
MKASFRLGRIAGVEVGVHYTWLVAFALITWTLADGFFPSTYRGWAQATYWITGAISAILLFGSVLVHELAHSLVARRRGLPVQGITLFIFGGVSSIAGEAKTARDEFVIAVVGPVTSLVLAALFWAAWVLLFQGKDPLSAIVAYLALINAMLGVFNLLPGFPLDGGRVLRAAIWGATRSLSKATRVAATVGQLMAFGFIGWGVFQLLQGNVLGGLWIAFIGWFLNGAADSARRETAVQDALRGITVREVMDSNPETAATETSVDALVRECFLQRGRRALPVQEDGRLVGIVTLTDVKGVPPERWPATRVAEIMTRGPLYAVAPSDDVAEALKLLAEHGLNQVPVTTEGRVVGLLSRADVIRYLHFLAELGLSSAARLRGGKA